MYIQEMYLSASISQTFVHKILKQFNEEYITQFDNKFYNHFYSFRKKL